MASIATTANHLPPIILVDDDEEALILIKNLFEKANVANPIITFAGAEELVRRLEAPNDSTQPSLRHVCLMLLDLKMPGMTGLDFLRWLHARPVLKNVVIVMLSTSDDPEGVRQATALGAHTYLLKYPSSETLGALVTFAQEGVPRARRMR